MGVAFKHCPVHKGARIALVTITDYVLYTPPCLFDEFPFIPCWKAGATSAPQTRVFYLIDDVVRCHAGEHFRNSCRTISEYIFIYTFGVNRTAISQNNLFLLTIKRNIPEVRGFFPRFCITEAFDDLTL